MKKPVWKPMKKISVNEFEMWIENMDFEPYLHDPFLQSIDWVNNLTKAIKKVEPLVGEGHEFEYKYWSDLQSWEFILNSLSITRAISSETVLNVNFRNKNAWKNILESFKHWVDFQACDPKTRYLFQSGTHFFYDMIQFFATNRTLVNPRKLARDVLGES